MTADFTDLTENIRPLYCEESIESVVHFFKLTMGTLTQLSSPVMSSMSSNSHTSLQPSVQVVGQSTDLFIGQEDILQDGGIRYLIRRNLVGHEEMEDSNFTDLFDSKDTTGDVTVICTNKSTDRELFFVKAHKHVLVKSCSFFQRYFEVSTY